MVGRRWLLASFALGLGALCGVWVWWHWPSPHRDFANALIALERGDLTAVAKTVHRLEHDPRFLPHASLLRGAVMQAAGNHVGALREFSRSPPRGELRIPSLLLTGRSLYSLGQLADAERLLFTVRQESPNHAEAHLWLGTVYHDWGRLDDSVMELRRAAELAPADHRPHRLLAEIAYDQSLYPDAIAASRRALELGEALPQSDMVQFLATSLCQNYEYQSAIDVLAESPFGRQAWALALQAECFLVLGKRTRATRLLRESLAQEPENVAANVLFGKLNLEVSHPELAVEFLERALRSDPHNLEAHSLLIQAYQRVGALEKSRLQRELLDASLKLHEQYALTIRAANELPEDPEPRERLAHFSEKLLKPELAAFWRRAAIACRRNR